MPLQNLLLLLRLLPWLLRGISLFHRRRHFPLVFLLVLSTWKHVSYISGEQQQQQQRGDKNLRLQSS